MSKRTHAKKKTGIYKVAENSFEIEQAALDNQLIDLSDILTQAKALPATCDGQPAIKIIQIQPNSIYAQLGLENND